MVNHKFPIIIEEYEKIKNPFKRNKIRDIFIYSFYKKKLFKEVDNPDRLKTPLFYKKVLVFILSIIV